MDSTLDSVDHVYKETTFVSSDYRRLQPIRGVRKYRDELGHLLPLRPGREKDEITDTGDEQVYIPERIDHLNCFQYVFFTWMTPVVMSIFSKRLQAQSISECSPHESCLVNSMRLRHLWEKEVIHSGLHNARLTRVLFRFIRTRFWVSSFCYLLCLTAGYLSSTYFVKRLLEEIEESAELTVVTGSQTVNATSIRSGWTTRHLGSEALKWTSLLCLCELFRALAYSIMFIVIVRTAARVANALSGMLYEKLLSKRTSISGLDQHKSIGGAETSVVNLFANDIWKVYQMIYMSPLIVGSPFIILVTIFYTFQLIGTSSFCGIALFVIIFVFQLLVTKVQTQLRRKIMVQTDRRVTLIGEIVKFIRAIKFNGWQDVFRQEIQYTRDHESERIGRYQYLQSLSTSLAILTPMLITIINILVHTVLLHRDLPISTAFSLIMLNYIAAHGIRSLPNYYREIANGRVALGRIERFLRTDDQNVYVSTDGLTPGNAIELKGAWFSFSRTEPAKIQLGSSFVLENINLVVPSGGHVCLYGPIGSGKSALLASILGQTQNFKGEVRLSSLKLAYVSQQPWLQNDSLRNNILFGHRFQSVRYYQTLMQCGLSVDIAHLADGEHTIIGDNGVQLSGGQKQRISLARAVYADADIYVLDDFSSALDPRMVRLIFKNILNGMLATKTIVFVARHLHLLDDNVCVALMEGGKMHKMGQHGEMLRSDQSYAQLVESCRVGEQSNDNTNTDATLDEDQEVFGIETSNQHQSSIDNVADNRLKSGNGESYESLVSLLNQLDQEAESEEEPLKGKVDHNSNQNDTELAEHRKCKKNGLAIRDSIAWHTYGSYIKAMGGYCRFAPLLALFCLQACTSIFSSWWLTFWLNEGDGGASQASLNSSSVSHHFSILNNAKLKLYASIYFVSFVIVILTSLAMGFVFAHRIMAAANRLHGKLLKKIINAPISFHDTVKIGSMINLFSHHIDVVDNLLPIALDSLLQRALLVVGSIVIIIATLYWLCIPIILVAIAFIIIFRLYRRATYWLRRTEVRLRRPIGDCVESTLAGKATIKAYGYESRYIQLFHRKADQHAAAFFLSESAVRWLSIRIDILCVFISMAVCIFVLVRLDSIGAAYAGLVITQSMMLSGLLQFVIRLALDLETRLFSVERIELYLRLLRDEKQQLLTLGQQSLASEWPSSGRISFRQVSLRYRDNLPLALNNVSLEISPGSRMAIVGRTGAGKSSITYALFRLVETCAGQIFIDGIDIRCVPLDVLRSRLSIIPQDPVLFHGSVRKNLDPTGRISDERLFEALNKVGLWDKIDKDLPDGLDEIIGDGGRARFSTGEKQLFCLARTLLRDNKVIVLDEPTASMDDNSEDQVWQVIEDVFKHATVILIAHRLNTVLRCQQLVVVQRGQVVEVGTPAQLMHDPNSRFSTMINKT